MAGVMSVYATFVLYKQMKNVTVDVAWKASKTWRENLRVVYPAVFSSEDSDCPSTVTAVPALQDPHSNLNAPAAHSHTCVLSSCYTKNFLSRKTGNVYVVQIFGL